MTGRAAACDAHVLKDGARKRRAAGVASLAGRRGGWMAEGFSKRCDAVVASCAAFRRPFEPSADVTVRAISRPVSAQERESSDCVIEIGAGAILRVRRRDEPAAYDEACQQRCDCMSARR